MSAQSFLYIDDEEEGLSPSTSHPRFVQLAPEGFYDEGDDFSPFGNDDGNDTLRALEGWYSENGQQADPAVFLAELLESWELNVPAQILDSSAAELITWLGEEDMNEVYISSEAQARVATALGQLKITGAISTGVLAEGTRGLRILHIITADTTRYPNWPHRAEALRALADIEMVFAGAAD